MSEAQQASPAADGDAKAAEWAAELAEAKPETAA